MSSAVLAAAELFRLDGKISLVTGAGSGLGRECALGLASAGARVICADRNGPWAQESVRLIETAGGVASSLVFDITSDDEVERAMHELEKSDGTLHVLINNAGVAPYPNRLHEADQHDWRRVLDVNLTGPFLVTRAFLPMMLRAGAGSIINIASLIGLYQAAERLTLGGIHKSPAT